MVIFKVILGIIYLFFGFVCASIYDSMIDDGNEPPMLLILLWPGALIMFLFVVMLNFAYLLGKRIAKWLYKLMEENADENMFDL